MVRAKYSNLNRQSLLFLWKYCVIEMEESTFMILIFALENMIYICHRKNSKNTKDI